MIGDMFKAIGIVFSLLIFTVITIAAMYLVYIFGLGILILSGIAIVFYILQSLRNKP